MADDAEDTWWEDGDEFAVLDLTIDPVEVPRAREREPSPLPVYSLRAPPLAAPTTITLRDLKAVAVGATIVAVLLAFWAWAAPETAQS